MWQYGVVLALVAAAGWYVFRRYRRTLSGGEGACACGSQEGCRLPEAGSPDLPPECLGCKSPLEGCEPTRRVRRPPE